MSFKVPRTRSATTSHPKESRCWDLWSVKLHRTGTCMLAVFAIVVGEAPTTSVKLYECDFSPPNCLAGSRRCELCLLDSRSNSCPRLTGNLPRRWRITLSHPTRENRLQPTAVPI